MARLAQTASLGSPRSNPGSSGSGVGGTKAPVVAVVLLLLLCGTFWQVNQGLQSFAPELYTDREDHPENFASASSVLDEIEEPLEADVQSLLKAAADQKDDNEDDEGDDEEEEDKKARDKEKLLKEEEEKSKAKAKLEAEKAKADATKESDQDNLPKKKPMNVVVFYPDDWRHDSIGGVAPIVRTPFLNELTTEGVRFTHNMVTTSICWISRATLFTGQYASRHKSTRLRATDFYDTWNESWPGLLRSHGYYTGHIGKWQYLNPDRYVEKNLFNHTNLFEGSHWFRGKHAADKTRDDTIEFLRNRPKDQPFSVTAAFYPPKAVGMSHEPGAQWTPKPETRAKYYENETIPLPPYDHSVYTEPYDVEESFQKLPWFFQVYEKEGRYRWNQRYNGTEKYQAAMKNYYSLVTEVDIACREIVEELKAQGVLDETLIIFTTDNGLFHSEHGLAGKWYPYQESIRVPLIVRDPRMSMDKRNRLDDTLTLNIDLAPTILGAAGIEPPERMQGRDIADSYLPPLSERNNDNNAKPAIEAKPWRAEFYYEFPSSADKIMPSNSAVVQHGLKYIYWPRYKHEQFFNLTADPLEQDDVINKTEYASLIEEFRQRHKQYQKDVK